MIKSSCYLEKLFIVLGINYVKVLIEYGADINAANKLGNTPLMTAAVNGINEIIQ